jgi:hypothetical protein
MGTAFVQDWSYIATVIALCTKPSTARRDYLLQHLRTYDTSCMVCLYAANAEGKLATSNHYVCISGAGSPGLGHAGSRRITTDHMTTNGAGDGTQQHAIMQQVTQVYRGD